MQSIDYYRNVNKQFPKSLVDLNIKLNGNNAKESYCDMFEPQLEGIGYCYYTNFQNENYVGFADYYLSDGDVMRAQFTLKYGGDIGGSGGMGGGAIDIFNEKKIAVVVGASGDASEAALAYAQGSCRLPSGWISAHWSRLEDCREGEEVIRLEITVENGQRGRILLPAGWEFEDGFCEKPMKTGTYLCISRL